MWDQRVMHNLGRYRDISCASQKYCAINRTSRVLG
jgi:hypothetical protein